MSALNASDCSQEAPVERASPPCPRVPTSAIGPYSNRTALAACPWLRITRIQRDLSGEAGAALGYPAREDGIWAQSGRNQDQTGRSGCAGQLPIAPCGTISGRPRPTDGHESTSSRPKQGDVASASYLSPLDTYERRMACISVDPGPRSVGPPPP